MVRFQLLWPVSVLLLPGGAAASSILLHGKVAAEDGSVPDTKVSIERFCGENPERIAVTNSKGEYIWRMDTTPPSMVQVSGAGASGKTVDTMHDESRTITRVAARGSCVLRASAPGFDSSFIDLAGVNGFSNPILPAITIVRHGSNPSFEVFSSTVPPRAAARAWNKAAELMAAGDWASAEAQLRKAVGAAPQFARGWNGLGIVLQNEHKPAEARDAYQHAVDADPKLLPAYLLLARLTIAAQDWEATAKTAEALIKADTKHRYLEIYLHQAVARFQLKDLDGAQASATELIQLDRKHEVSRAEYVLGLILEAKGDLKGSAERMQRYLDLEPRSADAGAVRIRLKDLNSGKTGDVGAAIEGISSNPQLGPAGEAWVPGGIRALSAVAHTKGTPAYPTFFADYARAVANQISPGTGLGIPLYLETLRTYLATVTELITLGERREDGTRITLHLGDSATTRALALFGWRPVQKGEVLSIEPGDTPADGVRQQLLGLFGVDEIALQKTLESGASFKIDIPAENARLIGGDAWSEMLRKDAPNFHGGLAEAFATDLRLARAYAGLGAMGPDAATALVSGLGLRTLVTQYADPLSRYGESFAVSKNGVVLPGGEEAEPAWRSLVGAPARSPAGFFRSLIEKDQGKLAAFYFAVSRGDAPHQRFFTKTSERTGRFYAWFRDSPEFRNQLALAAPSWRKSIFQDLPLDAAGNIKFPGGKSAWMNSSAPDEDLLRNLNALEALVPVAKIEARRQIPLDQRSASLLAEHYTEWAPVFSYFESFTALERGEFEALEAYTKGLTNKPLTGSVSQNLVLGEWYALVELIARGYESGSLDAAQSAAAFRHITEALTVVNSPEDAAQRALAALHDVTGGNNLHDAIARGLLRLSGERLAAFDRVLELQGIDWRDLAQRGNSIGANLDPAKVLDALSGFVYAAILSPADILVSSDPHLAAKHRFVPDSASTVGSLFSETKLVRANTAAGSYLTGGFMGLEAIARTMPKAKDPVTSHPVPLQAESEPSPAPIDAANEPVKASFRANGRLVEVYATVTDPSGKYVDDLKADQFSVIDQDKPQKIGAFESRFTQVSVTLLLDTTGSMQYALPALKNAALKLIDDLRPEDSVSVYSFSEEVHELQSFTTDKDAAKRAVLTTLPFGETALYDAMTRVSRDLAGRDGKKVIVLFTDGDDNFSSLTKEAAIARTEGSGVPVFTIAEGEALSRPEFLAQLASISKATGGEPFTIHNTGEIRKVFEKISEDLMHGYLLSFQPAPGDDHDWRKIQVVLPASKTYKVRAREGYLPE